MPQAIAELQYKNLPVKGLEVVDDEEGIVQAFVAGIGNKDHGADIIVPGAFSDSLKDGPTPKGVWSHDWSRPVSKTLEIHEVPAGDARLPTKMQAAGIGGLYVKTQFNLKTQDGRDAFENVKFYGEESEWSIGYMTNEAEYDKDKKANLLKKVTLFEYSPVLFGMNPLTATVGIKILTDSEGNMTVKVEGVEDDAQRKTIEEAVLDTFEDVEVKEEEGDPEVVDEVEEPEGDDDPTLEPEGGEEVTDPEGEDDPEGEEQEDPEGEPEEDGEKALSPVVESFMAFAKSHEFTPQEALAVKEFVAERSEKALAGSYEETRLKLTEALKDEFRNDPSEWIYVYATFDSTVIYAHESWDGEKYDYSYFQVSWTKDGDDFSFGDPVEVEIVEVVMAKMAVIEAAFKGHSTEVKNLLRPFLDVADATEGDSEVKSAILEGLEAKAGAVLSKANKALVESAYDALGKLLETAQEATEEKELDPEEVETPEGSQDPEVKEEEVGDTEVEEDDLAADLEFLESLRSA